jgi:hypothetical protein
MHQESGEQTGSLLKQGTAENSPSAQGDRETVPGDREHQQNPGQAETRELRRSRQRKASQEIVETFAATNASEPKRIHRNTSKPVVITPVTRTTAQS